MKSAAAKLSVLVALLVTAIGCGGDDAVQREPVTMRLATYNIEWFGEDANPERITNLKSVMENAAPHVVGMQEIQSLAALRQVFDDDWEIGIADIDTEYQELAIAVKKPFKLVESGLVFPGEQFDNAFPRHRDVMRGVVEAPNGMKVTVYVVHFKSRGGGRMNTDPRREAAASLLAAYVAGQGDEYSAVIGDFNDAPDDRCMNILESGDLMAMAGDNEPGRLLVNVTQELAAQDYVTLSLNLLYEEGNVPQPRVEGAKEDNSRLRDIEYNYPDDVKVMQAFFDQLLVSPKLAALKKNEANVYSGEDALKGTDGRIQFEGDHVKYTEQGTLASDHLLVYADFELR